MNHSKFEPCESFWRSTLEKNYKYYISAMASSHGKQQYHSLEGFEIAASPTS